MAKIYNDKTNEIMWSDSDVYSVVEDSYWELTSFLNYKRLDGHDERDQWYMAMANKLKELIDLMDNCPINRIDPDIKEIY